MERPSRKTKLVNYSDFQDLADDDDFASVKAPPSKKAKEIVKEPAQEKSKKPSNKASSQETSSQPIGHKNRKPLDEKLYDRDLEAALTLSLLKTTEINEEQCSYNPEKYVKNQPQRDCENLDPSLRLSNSSVDSNLLGLDQITNDRGSPCAPSRQRKAASKATEQQRSMLKDGDEDYNPKGTPESDADFSDPAESDDDEFTVKKPKKKNTEDKTAKKKQPKAKPKEEKQPSKPSNTKPHLTGTPSLKTPILGRSPTAKPASVPKRSPGTSPVSRSAVSGSPAGGRIPKWNPPGHVGRSPGSSQSAPVKSPGQGLRLGLSRMVRVKPLHPSVASH
ncbi:RAD51-associated protein 1-like [Oncorhynchus masou masou]|uniref:RAD51-associated protein 1-like n=1 Tax=Oncorhynchus masou masou TaxID=90313 RepID=UPI00318463E8